MSEIKNLKDVLIKEIFAKSRKRCFSFEDLKKKVKEIVEKKKIKVKIKVKKLKPTLNKLLRECKIYKKSTLKGVVRYCLISSPIPRPRSTIISAKIGTTGKIISSPTHSLSLMQLKKEVESNERILTIALQELYNEWKIRRVETSEGEYCLLPKYNINSATIGFKLYNVIHKEEDALTAKKLAEKVHLNPSYVFKICRRLKNGGYITTADPEEQQRFFAPLTGEIVHKGNYNRVKELNQELGGIVSKFSLKDPKLKQTLQSSLENMLEREDLAKFRKSIETFRESLLEKFSQVETKSEVRKILGFRPFAQAVTTWKKPS